MNFLNSLTKVVLIVIALAFTIIIGQIVPENQFAPYRLELDSTWAKEPAIQDYLVDLNNDHHYEIIRHNHINKPGHSFELICNKHISVLAIVGEKSFVISQFLQFADVNQDGVSEMLFIAVTDNIARLFIMEFDFKKNNNSPVPKIHQTEIDSVSYQNNVPDVVNYEILANGSDIYFDLQAGYYVQPRNVYKYNFQTKKLINTHRSSIVNKELELLKHHNQDYLLAKNVVATANTFAHEQAEKFRTSKNADSVKIYGFVKNIIYDYGDFSSYILLYNANLEFAFKPVEFFGPTNYTLSGLLFNDTIPQIISLTNNQRNDKTQRKITLCNLKGDIVKQLPATENYDHLYADRNTFALHFNQNLDIYSSDLKLEKRIAGLTFISGFYDITLNTGNEFIAFENNEIIVFSENLDRKTSFSIAQEFAPYPENNSVEILKKDGKSCFLFNTRLFYYLFSYEKNELAILKYPFYIMIFLFWSGILVVLLRFNARRLEKEKRHLEEIVTERTTELLVKNNELVVKNEEIQMKTEEIQMQAEEILQQYDRLEKLDQFKETLTHALVHDLKNPLSQVLVNTSNNNVRTAAGKMLRLITNMLDVEKYEKAGFILNKETLSLRNIITEVINGQEAGLKEKNLEVHVQFTDFKIIADKEVMVRVFDNLLSNALRYSPLNQSIDIKAEPSGDGMLHISMKNYGDPIPSEALPYIFDKYRYFGKSDSGAHRSTGLGLTFCKMAVEAHGGKIGARNDADEGCSFLFTMQAISQNVKQDENENNLPDLKPKLILTETEKEDLKEVVSKMKEFRIFEISRFHEVLDPLKATAGSHVNEWISRLFSAINIQNVDEYNRLINLVEDE